MCNFPPPADGKPSLLTHDDVTTVFHEFGHALHAMLTRARFGRYAGTNVPGDFVEAPSQMLENWPLDKNVLDQFAADYSDPSRKSPPKSSTSSRPRSSPLRARSTTGNSPSPSSTSFCTAAPADASYDCVSVSNDILAKVYLPIDPKTAMIASFGHLAEGYDAGYLRLRLGAGHRRRHGHRVPARRPAASWTRTWACGCARKSTSPATRATRRIGEKFLGRPRSTVPFLENDLGLKVETGHSSVSAPFSGVFKPGTTPTPPGAN